MTCCVRHSVPLPQNGFCYILIMLFSNYAIVYVNYLRAASSTLSAPFNG